MKSIFLAILASAGLACADTIPEWITLAGKHYYNVSVLSIQPDAISIRHEDGVARILFDNLTAEQRDAYQLSAEGRDNYLRQLREQQSAAALARKMEEAAGGEDGDPPAPEKPASTASPRYVTVDEIKRHWALLLPMPHILDRHYKELIRDRNNSLLSIAHGDRDREAQRKAAVYNRELALKAGDDQRVKQEDETLAKLDKEEAELAERAREDARQKQILAAIERSASPDSSSDVVVESPAPPVYSTPQQPCPSPCPPAVVSPGPFPDPGTKISH